MKALRVLMLAFVVFAVAVLPVAAQEKKKGEEKTAEAAPSTTPASVTFSGAGIGVGIGAALTIVGAGYGFGKIGSAALESMARQPEVAGRVQTAMLIIAALLERRDVLQPDRLHPAAGSSQILGFWDGWRFAL